MGFDSGSDRIAFEEQPAGAVGPPGPPGPAGTPYESVTTDTAALAGQVARRVSSGNVELAAGAAEGDGEGVLGLYGAAVSPAGTAQIYKSGSRCPVAGLPIGDLYRSGTGDAVLYSSLSSGDWTNRIGYSNGAVVDINVGAEERKP